MVNSDSGSDSDSEDLSCRSSLPSYLYAAQEIITVTREIEDAKDDLQNVENDIAWYKDCLKELQGKEKYLEKCMENDNKGKENCERSDCWYHVTVLCGLIIVYFAIKCF